MIGRRRRRGAWGVGVVFGLPALLASLWVGGLLWFVADIPRDEPIVNADTPARTDAVVVLTGGSRRLAVGMELLAAGRADRLFVSGVYYGVEVRELLSAWTHAPEALAKRVELGYAADSTIGNAEETATWARERGLRSIRLVTANYHMRRALVEFRRAMPGLEIVPHPVRPAAFALDEWWSRRSSATLLAGEYTKYLIASARSLIDAAFPGTLDDGPAR